MKRKATSKRQDAAATKPATSDQDVEDAADASDGAAKDEDKETESSTETDDNDGDDDKDNVAEATSDDATLGSGDAAGTSASKNHISGLPAQATVFDAKGGAAQKIIANTPSEIVGVRRATSKHKDSAVTTPANVDQDVEDV